MCMSWRKLLVWAVVFQWIIHLTDLLAHLSLLLALMEKSSFNVLFHFILLGFPGFQGQFFMNGKAKFRKPCCIIGSQKFYWLIYLQRNTCDESFYTKISEDTRKRCLRHLRFTVSSPNRNILCFYWKGYCSKCWQYSHDDAVLIYDFWSSNYFLLKLCRKFAGMWCYCLCIILVQSFGCL